MSDLRSKPRLGRGLSSLISLSDFPVEREIGTDLSADIAAASLPAASATAAALPDNAGPMGGDRVLELPVEVIFPNPHQPRRKMDETGLAELAASLKGTGLIQPIVVRKVGEQYQLVAGERRWRAARLAGFTTIPVIVKTIDEFAQAQMALVENIQRENLNPIDRALAYKTLIVQLGLTQAELAARLGEERSGIANHLRLLDLSELCQQMVTDGRLSLGHAKLLSGVPDILEQAKWASMAVSQDLSVRNLERLIQDARRQSDARPVPGNGSTPSAHLGEMEKTFSRHLGMRVQIKASSRAKGRGRVVIHYANLDQFDALQERLGIQVD